jgi:Flp pilus assembly protein TadB
VAARELRGLATPVRLSATLIGLAPPAVLGAVVAFDQGTASHAYATTTGRVAAVVGVALDVIGLWWIRRLTRFSW